MKQADIIAAKAAKENAAESVETHKLMAAWQRGYSSIMKPLQELQTILDKLAPETYDDEDAVEARVKIETGEELLNTFAEALSTSEGANLDDAREYVTSSKPLISKVKKLAAKLGKEARK